MEVELLPPGPYSVRYRSDRTVIGVALDRQRGVHSFASDRVRSFDAWPNSLANAADMSLFRFLRSFSVAIGMTPHAWIVEQRLQEARTQIENGKVGLADVAISCGFSSQSHMTEIFTRSMGISPAKYGRESRTA